MERKALSIGAGSVAEKGGGGKAVARAGLRPADSRGRLSPHSFAEQKSGPIAGATFQRGQFWWVVMKGKGSDRFAGRIGTSGMGDGKRE